MQAKERVNMDVLEEPRYMISSRDDTTNTMSREELKYSILSRKIW